MISVRNAYILHDDVRCTKASFLQILITVAYIISKTLDLVINQNVWVVPVEDSAKRHCSRCAHLKKDVVIKALRRMNISL